MPSGKAVRQFTFGKQQRLLTPSQYKAVFDGATFKSSHRNLLLLAVPNDGESARLGLVVAKKSCRLASQRNRLKRILREQFRLNQQALSGLDVVALVKPGLWQQDNAEVSLLVERQWRRLLKQVPTQGDLDQEKLPCAAS